MARLSEEAAGVFVIAATPFRDDGALDLASTDRLIEFYLERGATGLTLLGIMGEAPKLTQTESVAFVRHALQRIGGRVPAVIGASAPGFAAMAELARAATDAGAAGVMVAPTPGLRGDDAVFGYFATVAETLGDIPFVLQDYPQANGVSISAAGIRRIADAMPTCVMLKHEDWPALNKLSAVRAAPGRRISILCGNGGLFLPDELRRGADGAMTGFAFPEMMAGVVAAHVAADDERAAEMFDAFLPLARYEQQPGVGLAARKYVLAKRGAIASGAQRAPRSTLSPADIADLEFLLARQARRLAEIGFSLIPDTTKAIACPTPLPFATAS